MSAVSNNNSLSKNQESHPSFVCPITYCVMEDPVIDKHGHSFERSAITTWLKTSPTCPLNQQPLVLEDLAPNRALKELIETSQSVIEKPVAASARTLKPATQEQNDTMAQPLLEGAQKLEREGKLAEAEKFYLMAYQYTSRSEDYAHYPKLLEKKQAQEQAAEAYIILADLQQSENKPAEVILSLWQSYQLQPTPSTKERLARLLKASGKNRDASNLFLELAQQSLYQKDRQKGIHFCRQAIEAYAAWAEPWKTLAGVEQDPLPVLLKGARESSMPLKERISLCQMVLVKDPENINAQLLLLTLKHLKIKEKVKALQEVIIYNNLKIPPIGSSKITSTQTTTSFIPPQAFGAAKWNRYFGDVGAEPPLPSNIQAILSAPCPFFPGKTVQETHLLTLIPKTVNGTDLTLNTLGELVQKPKQGSAGRYEYYWDDIKNQYGNTKIEASYWVLFTKDVIPGSRNKTYDAQKKLVETLSTKAGVPYEVPLLLEAATSLFMDYVQTGTPLYSKSPRTFIRCQERVSSDPSRPLGVGGSPVSGPSSGGLSVIGLAASSESFGVGASRKFMAIGT